MSDVHTVRCPLSTVSTLSHVPGPLSIALWPSMPSAGRCACVARVLAKRAHKSHCAWHLSKKLSVYGFGSPRSIRCLHLCYGLRLSLVRLKVHSASPLLVLHATLRRLVSASSVLNVPKISSDFNCSLSSVSAGKFDCVCVCGPLYHSMPSYLSHGDTYVRFMVFASSESSQIGILMAALLKTDTNRLSYEASHKAKDLSDMLQNAHKHCYYYCCL